MRRRAERCGRGAKPPVARVTSALRDRLSSAMGMADRTTTTRMRRAAALAVLLAAVLAGPAAAADLTVQGTCFASGQQVLVTGTTFTPLAPVTIGGDVAATAQADATGAFQVPIAAPAVAGLDPRTVTVTAVDGANAANTATLRLNVVRAAFGSNLPIAGRPHDTTTWRFAGFAPGRPIYAHFLLGGRSRGDYRFGVAGGACGTLTARAPRIPGVRSLRPGRWTLKLDQRRTYHETTPGSEATFRIVRRANDDRGRDGHGGDGGGRRSVR
jgi:hypothetical protein